MEKDLKAIGSKQKFVPLVFQSGKMLELSGRELKFLEAWMRLGEMGKACEEQGLTQDQAKRILTRPKNREYMEDRMKEIAISKGLTAEWFMSQMHDVWVGKKIANREQMEAAKEIGRRAAPVSAGEKGDKDKFVINVNIGALAEAKDRQVVIEAERVKDNDGTGNT